MTLQTDKNSHKINKIVSFKDIDITAIIMYNSNNRTRHAS